MVGEHALAVMSIETTNMAVSNTYSHQKFYCDSKSNYENSPQRGTHLGEEGPEPKIAHKRLTRGIKLGEVTHERVGMGDEALKRFKLQDTAKRRRGMRNRINKKKEEKKDGSGTG